MKHRRLIALAALASATVVATSAALPLAPSVAAVTAAAPSLDYTPSPDWWGTNGRVQDIAVVGERVYIAGGFDYVGRTTGYGVGVDATSGALEPDAPLIDGIVRASVPDGSGGWYVAGDFVDAGGKARRGAAQITADGAVTNWKPNVKGDVHALAITPQGVALGGAFSSVGGATATNLAVVDPVTGAKVAGFSTSTNAAVRALTVHNGALYAGGDFTTVNGATNTRLVRLTATGAVDPAFSAAANASVRTLVAGGTTLYAGGSFTMAAGARSGYVPRSRLAGYSLTSGAVTSFAPAADNAVQALALDAAGNVYAGGLFGTIAGTPRTRLAQLSPTGAVGALTADLAGCHTRHAKKHANVNPPCTPEVSSLTVANGTLYVGGRFGEARGSVRHDAAAFTLATGALTEWNPVPGDRPLTLSVTGDRVFVGGEFTSVGGELRKGLAALDATTGALDTSFKADTNDFVSALKPSTDGRFLFLGGAFTAVQDQPRSYVASIDLASGQVSESFKPKLNNKVLTLAQAHGALYVGGKFMKVDRQPRAHAVKLDAVTGAVDPSWVVNTDGPAGALRGNGMVMGLEAAPDGSKVYLGGPFTSANGVAVTGGILVVNGTTGARTPQQLGGVGGCTKVGPWINRLYLSEDGKRLYGGDVCPDYVYQWDAVNLSSSANPTGLLWRTWCNGGMQGRYEVNGHFYYGTHGGDRGNGGRCHDRPGGTDVDQQRFYVFDAANGYLLPGAPQFDTPMGIWAYGSTPGGLLVGGDFTFAGDRRSVQQGLAFFPGTP